MNGICVINFNDILTDNALTSMINAANRWGVGFRQYREQDFDSKDRDTHPSALKLKVLNRCTYDRALILDADCIISEKAPDIFKVYDGSEAGIYLAPNNQNHFRKDLVRHLISEQKKDLITVMNGSDYNWVKEFTTAWEIANNIYVNCGVMLVNNSSLQRDIHDIALDIYTSLSKELIFMEQSPVNFIYRIYEVPIGLLDVPWNYCIPDRESWPNPNSTQYIYHWAGYENKQGVLENFDWRIKH